MIGDGEIDPNIAADFYNLFSEFVFLQLVFELPAHVPAGSGNGRVLSSETCQQARGVDTAATRSFDRRLDVGAVFKYKPVHCDDAVKRRVDSQCEDRFAHSARIQGSNPRPRPRLI